ncbi:MAG TPA: ABC transporter permease [Nocardioides sp.]|uniref:ABC transporter permease n=1 Tax=uncultured Nocardioides sp. TaxID=198441 RepID=UPI002620C925|nr:ABC transporter permease [uncultured Nocardioides sp.]HRD62230.1 ABC transporter permease [Nocardioides sp.]HRI98093.1 ABC transporter permease [Nocardioides sp.]HRK46300.1 ABC transporter permease [Nocardioides sp.]
MTLLAVGGASALSSADGPTCYSRLTNDWICAQYVKDFRPELQQATIEHLQITALAVLLGVLIAFPMALVARRYARLESSILGIATGIYTIPSLALLPLMVPFTGLSKTTVVIALALYALTILVRAILEGLRGVPDEVVEAARGLGYGPTRLLFRVELPLALPVIMAGLRVATVSTVALTTIGSLVAYGGLGNLIKDGVNSNFRAELFTASLLCVVIAVLLDVVIVLTQRAMTPWARGVRA